MTISSRSRGFRRESVIILTYEIDTLTVTDAIDLADDSRHLPAPCDSPESGFLCRIRA